MLRGNPGFTLAETLLAVSLLAVISIGITGAMSSAINTEAGYTASAEAERLLKQAEKGTRLIFESSRSAVQAKALAEKQEYRYGFFEARVTGITSQPAAEGRRLYHFCVSVYKSDEIVREESFSALSLNRAA